MGNLLKKLSIFVMLVLMIVLAGCGGKKTININDYYKVQASGANGRGVLSLADGEKDLYSFLEASDKKLSDWDVMILGEMILDCIEFEGDKEENLSNGDKIKITCKIDKAKAKELGYTLKFKEYTYTVEGLKDLPMLKDADIWDAVTITYAGMSGSGRPELTVDSKYLNTYMYDVDLHSNDVFYSLRNGDVITITFNGRDTDEYVIDENVTKAKDFVVSGLLADATSLEQISKDDLGRLEKCSREFLEECLKFRNKGALGIGLYDEKDKSTWLYYLKYDVENVKLDKIYSGSQAKGEKIDDIYFLYNFDIKINDTDDGNHGKEFKGKEFKNVSMGIKYDGNFYVDENGNCELDPEKQTYMTDNRNLYTRLHITEAYANSESWYKEHILQEHEWFTKLEYVEYDGNYLD